MPASGMGMAACGCGIGCPVCFPFRSESVDGNYYAAVEFCDGWYLSRYPSFDYTLDLFRHSATPSDVPTSTVLATAEVDGAVTVDDVEFDFDNFTITYDRLSQAPSAPANPFPMPDPALAFSDNASITFQWTDANGWSLRTTPVGRQIMPIDFVGSSYVKVPDITDGGTTYKCTGVLGSQYADNSWVPGTFGDSYVWYALNFQPAGGGDTRAGLARVAVHSHAKGDQQSDPRNREFTLTHCWLINDDEGDPVTHAIRPNDLQFDSSVDNTRVQTLVGPGHYVWQTLGETEYSLMYWTPGVSTASTATWDNPNTTTNSSGWKALAYCSMNFPVALGTQFEFDDSTTAYRRFRLGMGSAADGGTVTPVEDEWLPPGIDPSSQPQHNSADEVVEFDIGGTGGSWHTLVTADCVCEVVSLRAHGAWHPEIYAPDDEDESDPWYPFGDGSEPEQHRHQYGWLASTLQHSDNFRFDESFSIAEGESPPALNAKLLGYQTGGASQGTVGVAVAHAASIRPISQSHGLPDFATACAWPDNDNADSGSRFTAPGGPGYVFSLSYTSTWDAVDDAGDPVSGHASRDDTVYSLSDRSVHVFTAHSSRFEERVWYEPFSGAGFYQPAAVPRMDRALAVSSIDMPFDQFGILGGSDLIAPVVTDRDNLDWPAWLVTMVPGRDTWPDDEITSVRPAFWIRDQAADDAFGGSNPETGESDYLVTFAGGGPGTAHPRAFCFAGVL